MIIKKPENFNEQIEQFGKCLEKFNKIHSITNYNDLSAVIEDSLEGLKFITEMPKVAIDIGSGAGFPAIFLAMVLPYTKWHLFEPNTKKAAFLTYAKVNLKLKNIIIHNTKIENETPFIADLITSRAVMKVPDLIKISHGFFDTHTKFLFYKGSNVKDELGNLKAEIFENNIRKYALLKGNDVY